MAESEHHAKRKRKQKRVWESTEEKEEGVGQLFMPVRPGYHPSIGFMRPLCTLALHISKAELELPSCTTKGSFLILPGIMLCSLNAY